MNKIFCPFEESDVEKLRNLSKVTQQMKEPKLIPDSLAHSINVP